MLSLLLMAEIIFRDEDARLVHSVLSGNQSAFEEIVRKYEKMVYNTAYQFTMSTEDAFDVSQETFIKAYRSLGSFRGDCKFSSWLYRITQNAASDFLRAKSNNSSLSLTDSDDDGENAQLDVVDDSVSSDPQMSYERDERKRAVWDAINALSEDHREIIVMRDIEGMSYDDISEALDIEIGTVKSRINRARAAIKVFLEKRNFL